MEEKKTIEQNELIEALRKLLIPEREVVCLDVEGLMERYGVGRNKALELMRCIRSTCGGGKLGAGKVLMSEVRHWESIVWGQ